MPKSLDVGDLSTVADLAGVFRRDPQCCADDLQRFTVSPDTLDVFAAQPTVATQLVSHGVELVLPRRGDIKMRRLDAIFYVATVANMKAVRNGATISHFPRDSMGSVRPSVDGDYAVAATEFPGGPQKAPVGCALRVPSEFLFDRHAAGHGDIRW